jgi:hypothetical protein
MPGPRADIPGQRNPGNGSRIPATRRRIVARCRGDLGSGARLSDPGQRGAAGKFGAGSTGRGSACFTGLIAHSWPVTGHKKTPASRIPAGALWAL